MDTVLNPMDDRTHLELCMDKLRDELTRDEGWRDMYYRDSVGLITIGVGHNLDHKPLSKRAIDIILEDDIIDTIKDCKSLPYWKYTDKVRRRVIANMVFNLGKTRFLKFKHLNKALLEKNYPKAAAEMADSKWYRQVGIRAKRLTMSMQTGESSYMEVV